MFMIRAGQSYHNSCASIQLEVCKALSLYMENSDLFVFDTFLSLTSRVSLGMLKGERCSRCFS